MAYLKISDRVFDKTITLRNAFEILSRFVEQYHARGESSTGSLLADLSLGTDGTPIVTHFFPAPGLEPGERQPTVLYGPGWSGAGQTDTAEPSTVEQVGIARMLAAGYNVVTWDPRGFGGSGDVAHVDSPDHEARDVSALIDLIAAQPEARLDSAGDPRVGMVGGSYGGGIQWVTFNPSVWAS